MNKFFDHLPKQLAMALLLIGGGLAYAAPPPPQSLPEWITQAIPHTNYQPHVGIIIQSATTGDTLFEENSEQLFTPASIQKLYVATAALLYLHPSFTFNTTITTNALTHNGNLQGDAYLHFSGDPYLTTDNLQSLISQLKQQGIRKIRGHLYLDTQTFDTVSYPPGWLWGDLSYSFAAPLSTANLNQNKFLLHLTPATTIGEPPILSSKLPSTTAAFTNNVTTTSKYNKACPITVYSDAEGNYTLGGCLVKSWGKQRRSLAIRHLEPYVIEEVRHALKQQGITVKQIEFKNAPSKQLQTLASFQSRPLAIIAKKMLTQSDNLAADALLKTLGATYNQQPGTWQNGIHAMQDILSTDTGIDFHQTLLTDGAGLSRYNLTTPKQFAKLLYFIDHNPTLKNNLISALPKPGTSGTLMYRLISTKKSQRIVAKTGTMTGISSLAGFVNTKHNDRLIFVIMVNGFVGPARKFQHFEDRLCKWLINTPETVHA